jgi:hypothetical protein
MNCQGDYNALAAKSGVVSLNPEWVVTLNRNWVVNFSGISSSYFQLQASMPRTAGTGYGLLPTEIGADGTRGGEIVTGRSKKRSSGQTYSANLSDLAKSGLLPTPTTGSNRNSRNAVQKIGDAHQHHGVSLGLAQVVEISTGVLPKEFDHWDQVPVFYRKLLPTLRPRISREGVRTVNNRV